MKPIIAPIPGMLDLLMENQARLPMFTIYDRPTDFPEHYVARLWFTLPKAEITAFTILRERLDDLRDIMESCGLVKLMRDPADDPKIVEVWL